MSNDTLYEHPLNEQVRVYLRLEYLLNQINQSSSLTGDTHWSVFFKSLFELAEILEQVQVKGDLAKDLEKQRSKLEAWLNVPNVDTEQLTQLLQESRRLQQVLLQAPRLGQALREDKFLSSIRQRFSIPGGTCSFDLPSLHHWLNLPLAHRQSDANTWTGSLKPLENALTFWLRLTRGGAALQPSIVINGFYQQDVEGATLLRIQISPDYNAFPLVSGHKSRFAIRFMPFDENQTVADTMALSIAVC
ncbi:cell division protein ZapD [Enterovibrio makurazakiensis]|uniref:Cell division protein ZapD n=1 Tax=Enterovibrio gelatinilyticus TaxID=2899819 RepID=A0ABT5QVE6_9GAMM|nr:cell division protein ZapD [Enterovibrio sp. ZSDZ42]MDD1791983.1 cell division protein ZapD [Enterovibrio sp. ZSDZ42]